MKDFVRIAGSEDGRIFKEEKKLNAGGQRLASRVKEIGGRYEDATIFYNFNKDGGASPGEGGDQPRDMSAELAGYLKKPGLPTEAGAELKGGLLGSGPVLPAPGPPGHGHLRHRQPGRAHPVLPQPALGRDGCGAEHWAV